MFNMTFTLTLTKIFTLTLTLTMNLILTCPFNLTYILMTLILTLTFIFIIMLTLTCILFLTRNWPTNSNGTCLFNDLYYDFDHNLNLGFDLWLVIDIDLKSGLSLGLSESVETQFSSKKLVAGREVGFLAGWGLNLMIAQAQLEPNNLEMCQSVTHST